MQQTPEIVLGIAMKPDKLYSFLVEAVGISPKLQIVNEDEGALKMRFAKVEKDRSEHHFDLVISYEGGEVCDLHFTPANPKDTQKLASAVAAMLVAISKYGQRINTYTDQLLRPKQATDADIERVATFLQEHRVATVEQISNALGMLQLTVAMSLSQLFEKGIVGRTPSEQSKFFFK